MRNQMLAAVAMALLAACVGGIDTSNNGNGDDDTPAPGASARQIFDSQVAPLLSAKCATCHVGPETSATDMFLGPDGPSSFYTTLSADRAIVGNFNPDSATILLKGAHEGPPWTTDEKTKITTWLQAELTARGTTDPGPVTGNPGATARGAEMAFAGCMTAAASLTDYTTLKPYQVANLQTGQGRCNSCHSPGGAGGQWLGTTPNNTYTDMFAKWQEEVFFTGVFQAQIQPDNTYKISSADLKICNKGKEKANSLGNHPPFDCQQNNGVALAALKSFATAVQGRVDAHDATCATPAFATPTP
jgi:mono/diheme cytochrome c family protein